MGIVPAKSLRPSPSIANACSPPSSVGRLPVRSHLVKSSDTKHTSVSRIIQNRCLYNFFLKQQSYQAFSCCRTLLVETPRCHSYPFLASLQWRKGDKLLESWQDNHYGNEHAIQCSLKEIPKSDISFGSVPIKRLLDKSRLSTKSSLLHLPWLLSRSHLQESSSLIQSSLPTNQFWPFNSR